MENCLPGTEPDNMRTNRRMQRRSTDFTGKLLFFIVSGAWIVLLAWAVLYQSFTTNGQPSNEIADKVAEIWNRVKDEWFKVVLEAILGLFLAIAFLFVTRRCNKFFCCLTIICVYILPPLLACSLFFPKTIITAQLIVTYLVYLVICGAVMIGIKKVNRETMYKLSEDSCRAIFFYPKTVFIAIASFYSIVVIMMLSLYISFAISTLVGQSATAAGAMLALTLACFNVLAYIWITLVIWDVLELFILTSCTLWCSTDNKETLTSSDINEQVFPIIRSHFGTMCFGSSPIGPIVKFITIFRSESVTWENIKKNPIIVVCIWLLYMAPDSSIYNMMIIYGTDFVTSAKRLLDLIVKNPWNYFVWKIVVLGAVLGKLLLPFLIMACIAVPSFADFTTQGNQVALSTTDWAMIYLVLQGFFIMSLAIESVVNAIHICAVIDNTKNTNKSNNFRALAHNP